jgi:hypothetical protein
VAISLSSKLKRALAAGVASSRAMVSSAMIMAILSLL